LQKAYKEMSKSMGNPKHIFGLSGGIDSALNMTVCCLTLGKKNVLAYALPSVYNGAKTKQAAKKVCANLGVKLNTIAIDNILKAYKKALGKVKQITEENLQARVRSTILMAQTSEHNGILINNTNKVELALGYGTLYGDLAGAWCPIGDLTKVEIWGMARFINKKFGKLIPEELIPDESFKFSKDKIIPSAELKNNQVDPMVWGFDDWLVNQESPEKVLQGYINAKKSKGKNWDFFVKYGFNDAKKFIKHVEWFFNTANKNQFKRLQAPPVLVMSKTPLGKEDKENYKLTKKYKELKRQLI